MKFTHAFYDALPPEAAAIRQAVFVEEQGFQEEFDAIDRHALHTFLLSVPRPFDGEYLTLTAPLPTDFSALLPRFGLHTTQDMEVLIHEKQLFSGKEF